MCDEGEKENFQCSEMKQVTFLIYCIL